MGTASVAAQGRPVYETGEWEVDLARRELRVRGAPLPLGDRAFDLIEILVEAAGDIVAKDALMARVWPGAIVEENTLHVHISALRKVLGSSRTLLKTVPGRGYRLLGDWTSRREGAMPEEAALDPVGTPARPALATERNLIGRAAIVLRLQELLSTSRMVTLTGPGGIGKTALSLEVARTLLPAFQGDVWPVELAALSDPGLVPSAVASALGLKLGTEIAAESVARAIGERNLLIVLDNCEHVIDAAAKFVEAVARRCPRVSILATSREVLRTEGECVYRVPPLDVPPSDHREPDQLLGHGAVQLFVARASALHADFSLQPESLAAIAAICRRLDGIPLAIEFAAACAAALGPAQVEARLDDRFALLTQGHRTALPRQQTLRATLDWSYELLPEAERRLLRRLAIFPAGFTLEAAIAIQADGGGTAPVLDGLASLVAKSLVTSDRSALARRWRLLETIRVYAHEKLVESGEAAGIARRHAELYRDLLAAAGLGVEDNPHLGRELDNLRAALDWAFSPAGDAALAVGLTVAAVPLWIQASLMAECRARVEQAMAALAAQPDRDPRWEMQLLVAWATALLLTQGAAPEMYTAYAAALAIAEDFNDTEYRLRALWGLFVHHFTRGDHRAALACAERFARFAASVAAPADRLIGERMIGTALHILGNQADARRHIEPMLARFGASNGRPHAIRFAFDQGVSARSFYARILWLQGFADQALETAGRTVAEARHLEHPASLFYALVEAACPIALLAGDLAAADAFVAMVRDVSVKHAMDSWNAWGRCLQGSLRIRQGAASLGRRLLQSGLADLPEAKLHYHYTTFLADLALALGRSGQAAAGLATIDDALARGRRNEEGWCLAELLRLKGELVLMAGAAGAVAVADDLFQRSLDGARRLPALAWELRTAVSLARLRIRQGRPDDAALILGPIYDKVTEGYGTADLRAAKAVLGALRAQSPSRPPPPHLSTRNPSPLSRRR